MFPLVSPVIGRTPAESDTLRRFTSLPDWLMAIADPVQVRLALERDIPEFARGELLLRRCEVSRVRLKADRRRWTAMYALTVDGPASGERRDLAVHGTLLPPGDPGTEWPDGSVPFGTEAWRHYVPELHLDLRTQPPDTDLPALPILTDPDAAKVFLEQSIRAGSHEYRGIRIGRVQPRVMRYKPGSRCTVLYRLEYPAKAADPRWPEIVIAKTYRGEKGQIAYDGMRALWNSPLAAGRTVTIAEPLAYRPEMNVLVQGGIPEETTLAELIEALDPDGPSEAMAELHDHMRKTARGLVELHRSGVRAGETMTWEDELAEVREVSDRLANAVPALAGAAKPLLERLQAAAMQTPADPPVPSHGTFRPAQVLLHRRKVGFIDFDGFCEAEPAMDLALFMSKLKEVGLRVQKIEDENERPLDRAAIMARIEHLEALGETFLAEYEAHWPVSRVRVALWQALDLFTLVLHSWTKVKPARLNASAILLERHLTAHGWV